MKRVVLSMAYGGQHKNRNPIQYKNFAVLGKDENTPA
jgi:hypothetical protein